jgi:nucleotide-binding universal stress UspA family protein
VFERIVVGFDESEGSRDALALGRRLADRLGADLVVVGVVPLPTGGSLMPALPANAFTNLVEQAEAGINKAAEEFRATTEIVQSSSAARGLEELTEKLEGDLLVLGCTRTDPGLVRAGHKARVLMQGSRCAVALAPVGYRDTEAGLSVIGVAIDGSPEAAHALDAAVEIAGGEEVRLIAVATDLAESWGFWGATYALTELGEGARHPPPNKKNPKTGAPPPHGGAAPRAAAKKILDQAAGSLPEGVNSTTVMAEGFAPIELRKQSGEGLDLLCLGSRGYGPLLRVLLGSVSSELVHEVSCPVVLIPRGADPDGAGAD